MITVVMSSSSHSRGGGEPVMFLTLGGRRLPSQDAEMLQGVQDAVMIHVIGHIIR